MRSLFRFLLLCVFAVSLVGCGGKSNPNADVAPDQMAPAPENVDQMDGYAEAMGENK